MHMKQPKLVDAQRGSTQRGKERNQRTERGGGKCRGSSPFRLQSAHDCLIGAQ